MSPQIQLRQQETTHNCEDLGVISVGESKGTQGIQQMNRQSSLGVDDKVWWAS